MKCEQCAWHVRVHYSGTPKNEIYDECEYHNIVLHSDDNICPHFTTDRCAS